MLKTLFMYAFVIHGFANCNGNAFNCSWTCMYEYEYMRECFSTVCLVNVFVISIGISVIMSLRTLTFPYIRTLSMCVEVNWYLISIAEMIWWKFELQIESTSNPPLLERWIFVCVLLVGNIFMHLCISTVKMIYMSVHVCLVCLFAPVRFVCNISTWWLLIDLLHRFYFIYECCFVPNSIDSIHFYFELKINEFEGRIQL